MEKINVTIERSIFKGTQFVKRQWKVLVEDIFTGTVEETTWYDADGFETNCESSVEYPSGYKEAVASYREGLGKLLYVW